MPQISEPKIDDTHIRDLFDEIADKYDFTNSIISFGLHHLWNKRFVRDAIEASSPTTILDVCAGTGEITAHMLKLLPHSKYTLLDFSPRMLDKAKIRLSSIRLSNNHKENIRAENIHTKSLQFVTACAEKMPLPSNTFDLVTLSYGIRNIKNPAAAIEECFRVLRPGGKLAILELTRPTSTLLTSLHTCYLHYILPLLGAAVTRNKKAYTHLKQSVLTFMSADQLCKLMEGKGFTSLTTTPYHFGSVTSLHGVKPICGTSPS